MTYRGERGRSGGRSDVERMRFCQRWRFRRFAGTLPAMPTSRTRAPRRLHVLVLHGCAAVVPIGIVDMLRKAAVLAAGAPRRPAGEVEVSLVAPDRALAVTSAGGISIPCTTRISDVDDSDLVVVPAVDPDIDQ